MSKWNPGDILTDSDKLIIQQNPGAGQAKLAQQILAERQIVEAYVRAGLGKKANEKAILGKILKHIDEKTALKKAIAEAKEKAKPGSLTDRISQSKRGINKPKLIKLDRKGNVIPPKELTEVSPGVAVGPNYKPGRDPAVDALLQKLARDGADSLDSSGFGGSVGGDMQRIVND